MVESVLDTSCPMCNRKPLRINTEIINIPYFNEVLSTTINCDKCDHKYSDTLITEQNKPMEHKLVISSVEDMKIRVIRSSSGTVELPELGIKIEPGIASEAYISNIEGVLVRVSEVLEQAHRFFGKKKNNKTAKNLLKKIRDLQNGVGRATIIIKDPMGNSAILSEKVETRELTPDEIKMLETGLTIIDATKE
jgi:zinc finger protein